MAKKVKLPADTNKREKSIVAIATGETPETTIDDVKAAAALGHVSSPKIRPPQFRVNNRFVSFKFYNYAKKIYGKLDCIRALETGRRYSG
jgi:hypothetical protein